MSAKNLGAAAPPAAPLNVEKLRADFPILGLKPRGKDLIYLDNAATSQKPRQVIEAVRTYYEAENANIHRGLHYLSQLATEKYDQAREKVQRFVNAASPEEIVFTAGNTDGLNLVASSYGSLLKPGDEVVLTQMEHHSNIIPWQLLRERIGITIKVAPVTDAGELDFNAFLGLLTEKTKVVSVVHVSNALGTINPVKDIIRAGHEAGATVMLDAAQSAPHLDIDVQALDCDFLSFSPHKMLAPTGIGVLYGKAALLERMPPYRGGGGMIRSVSFDQSTFADPPEKFEAGTPNIAGAIGLGAAVDYLEDVGIDKIGAYESDLLKYATEALAEVPGLLIIGTAKHKAAVLSFVMENAHPHDIGQVLDGEGVAIRAGHHCTQPLMQRFGIPATARASLAFYNTREEVDRFVAALHKVNEVFG